MFTFTHDQTMDGNFAFELAKWGEAKEKLGEFGLAEDMEIPDDAFDPELGVLLVLTPADSAGYVCSNVVSGEDLKDALEAAGLMRWV